MSLSDTKKKGDKKMKLPAHVQEHIDSLKAVAYFSGSSPLPEGCVVYETRRDAYDAGYAAARDAARDAASRAAYKAAYHAAKKNEEMVEALDAAEDAAWDAAEDAVQGPTWDPRWDPMWNPLWDPAHDPTWGAAWDAAKAAALFAICLLMQDLIDPEHLAYALQRWAIWQAGYGVAVEAGGVHYCYRRP